MLDYEAIYVYTDSTGFPRSNLVSIRQIWPNLISGSEVPVILRGGGGYSSRDMLRLVKSDAFYFSLNDVEDHPKKIIVILFFGVVDCAPRPITYKLRYISKVPFFGNRIWGFLLSHILSPNRTVIQKFWKYQLVSNNEFKVNLRRILKSITNPNVRVLICETPMPSEYVLKRSPGFEDSVKVFNSIKNEIAAEHSTVSVIELERSFTPTYVSEEDGHHFSAADHLEIASKIRESFGRLKWV
jgi:hypothetical protein